jgi:hypothetical protein
MRYDKETEKSIYCDACILWRDDVGCLHNGMGLIWDTEDGEKVLSCNTDTSDPELLEMFKDKIIHWERGF